MTDDGLDRAAYDAFALGVRVMYHVYGIEAPGTDYEKPYALLKQIAEGRLTLSNPADMAARFPAMRDLLYDSANRVVEHDRRTATRVLRGLGEAFE